MKLFLLLIVIPSLVLSAPKKPSPTPTPKGIVEKQGMVCRTKQQDLELRDWINGLINEVHKAQADTKFALDANAATQSELTASQKAATDLANECAKDKECAKAPLSCWFHRLLKHILWVALVLIAVLIVVTILAPGVVPAISNTLGAIWAWIMKIFRPKTP